MTTEFNSKMTMLDTCFFFAINQGSKDTKEARDICTVNGEGGIIERTAQTIFLRFKKVGGL